MQEPLDASLVRIRTPEGRVVGVGFLVGERQVLTCAHVISQALGLAEAPVDLPQAAVSLDFPFVPPRTLFTAKVVLWCPPLSDGSNDIAGLQLQSEPPTGVQAVRFAEAADVWEHPFRAFGFPAGYDDGVWATGRLLGRQATDWIMIEDVKAQGFAVAPGFSGTPVWDTQLQGVVGMVVAASRPADTKAAFVIPLDVLAAVWPLIEPISRQRIFLSAAPADAAFADRLAADLQAWDIVVWSEQHTPGEDQSSQAERLRQAIRSAHAVVLVVSSQTRSSRTVKEHLRLADLYARRLILVWVGDEPAQPQQYGWRETILVDVHNAPYEAALEAIEATLNQRRTISTLLGPSHMTAEEEQKEPRNPYKGLRAFTADDAGDFFGRERLVDELVKDVEKLLTPEQPATASGRLLTIIGPSGSGKSSGVMAGLLPRLQHGALSGSEHWVYLEPMVPGKYPIESLGLTLARHFPDRSFTSIREDLEDDATRGLHVLAIQLAKRRGSKVVLLVDQFEELFTQTASEDERQRFIDLLLVAAAEPRGPLLLLLTLRADFSHYLMQYPELYQLIKAYEKPLLPMEIGDLRATIEQPAALPDVQITFEGNLIGDLLFEVQGQAGALPLLQFTLEQLFERRSGHRLTLQAYREIGGVKGALAQQAEATYGGLPSEEHRKLARALFLRLIDPGVTEQDTTRRRAALSELSLSDPEQTTIMREAADAFIAARLLTTSEIAGSTTIEVSHEALIREWMPLSGWLREVREDIALQQGIGADVADWVRRGRPVDRLYRGTQLAEAQAWAERNVSSRDEMAFLQASAAEREQQHVAELNQKTRELALQRRVVSRQRLLVVALSIFSVVVIVLALVAEVGRLQAEQERQNALLQTHIASSQALAAQANSALVSNHFDQALLLSLKANQTYDTYDARDSLLTALEHSPRIIKMLRTTSFTYNPGYAPNTALAFNPDGQTLLSLGPDGGGGIWNTQTGKSRSLSLSFDFAESLVDGGGLAISPNAQIAASNGRGGLRLWSMKTRTKIAQLSEVHTHPCSFPGSSEKATCSVDFLAAVAFSPDGTILAATGCSSYPQGSCIEGQIVFWDVASPKPTSQLFLTQGSLPLDIVFSPDGKMLAVGNEDGTVQLWDVASKSLIAQFSSNGAPQGEHYYSRQEDNVSFSPNGKMLAVGNANGTISLWDIVSKKLLRMLPGSHIGAGQHIAFSPHGTILASVGSDDKTIQLWDMAAGEPNPQLLVGHMNSVSSLAFSQDGKVLVSIDESGTIIMWNMVADSLVNQKQEYFNQISSATFSVDGKVIITGDDQGRIMLRERTTGKYLGTLDATLEPTIPPNNPGGNQFNGSPLAINNLALSPDGQTLASGRIDGMIILWNMKTRQAITHFKPETHLNDLVFSPDGRTLALGYDSGRVLLWDIATGKALHSFTHHITSFDMSSYGQMSSVDFSRDGKILASGDGNTVVLWDVVTRRRIGQPLRGHTSDVERVIFSPDGHTLASVDSHNTIILWNVATKKPLQPPLNAVDQNDLFPQVALQIAQFGFTFSPDGKHLALASVIETSPYLSIAVWNVATFEPLAHVLKEPFDNISGVVKAITFSPDGQQLLSFTPDGHGSHTTLWNVNPTSWQTLACTIANRNFTMNEWRQFARGEAYQRVCPQLPSDRSVVTESLDQAHAAYLASDQQAAASAYVQTVRWAMESDDADANDGVCWQGSLDGFARTVLPTCDHAIELNPNNVNIHDSRGLARALVGDTQGAIADFKFVLDPAHGYGYLDPDEVKQRQSWLQALEAGRNPFDAATLKALQSTQK